MASKLILKYFFNAGLAGPVIVRFFNILLFIEGGRVKDTENYLLKTALRKVAEIHDGDFLVTGNQNLQIRGISEKNKLIVSNNFCEREKKTKVRKSSSPSDNLGYHSHG